MPLTTLQTFDQAQAAPVAKRLSSSLHRVLVWAVQADQAGRAAVGPVPPLLHVYVVDVDAAKEVARQQVQSMPTFCLYRRLNRPFFRRRPGETVVGGETAMKVNLPFQSMAGTVQQPRRREY